MLRKTFFTAILALTLNVVFTSCSKRDISAFNLLGSRQSVLAGDFGSVVNISNLKLPSKNLYGLGPIVGLKGEITVINNKPYLSKVINKEEFVTSSWDSGACFFAYSYVNLWDRHWFDAKLIDGKQELESLIEELLGNDHERGQDPLPFIIEAIPESLNYHIMNNDGKHKKHHKLKFNLNLENKKIKILGFYSKETDLRFMHKGQKIHMHFVSEDELHSGHIDKLKNLKVESIMLPAV